MITLNSNLNLHQFSLNVDSLNQQHSLTGFSKKKFSEQIEELKKFKNTHADKKHTYALPLYSTILLKIIELVRVNKCLAQDPSISHAEKANLEQQNENLNRYYDKYFAKYARTPHNMTVRDLIENEIYSHIPFLGVSQTLTPEEITQKKKLADVGYSMMTEVKNWLDSPVIDANQSFGSIIQTQVSEFITWAESHPRTASYLVSDIALTSAVLLEKQASEQLFISINSMVFTKMFLDALGVAPKYEEVEDQKLLKFRALADFISYCPMMATGLNVAKKTLNGEYTSFFSFATSAIREASTTAAIQKITRLIPHGHEKLVSLVLSVIRGHDLQEILAEQRNLSLIQLAGVVKTIIKNPFTFLISFEVWWKTAVEATGHERVARVFIQLIMPAAAIALFAASLFSTGAILAQATIITAATLSLSFLLTSLIDASDGYKIKGAVLDAIKTREKRKELLRASLFLKCNSEKKQEINAQAKTYIADLQKKHALPQVPAVKGSLDASSRASVDKIKAAYLKKLEERKTLKNKTLTAAESVALFNEVVDLKKIREKLPKCDERLRDVMVFTLAQNLIDEWLVVNLEEAFKAKLLELYDVKEEDYSKIKPVKVDEYLKKTIEQKIKDEATAEDQSKEKSVFKSLRKSHII